MPRGARNSSVLPNLLLFGHCFINGIFLPIGRKIKWLFVGGKIVRLNRKANRAFNEGRYEEAFKLLFKAIDSFPDYAISHHNLGNLYMARGNLTKAEESFKKAVGIKPNFVEAWNDLGSTVYKLGRAIQAEKLFKKAIEIDPQYGYAHYNLGQLYMSNGQFSEAEEHFKRALESKKVDENTKRLIREQMVL
jgi:tetratricopeptide (TPR) repeat protein